MLPQRRKRQLERLKWRWIYRYRRWFGPPPGQAVAMALMTPEERMVESIRLMHERNMRLSEWMRWEAFHGTTLTWMAETVTIDLLRSIIRMQDEQRDFLDPRWQAPEFLWLRGA